MLKEATTNNVCNISSNKEAITIFGYSIHEQDTFWPVQIVLYLCMFWNHPSLIFCCLPIKEATTKLNIYMGLTMMSHVLVSVCKVLFQN